MDNDTLDDEQREAERQTEDDALQPPDDLFNPRRDEERLEEDGDSPAGSSSDAPEDQNLPPDHPEFDYDRDAQEAYDAGDSEATGAESESETLDDRPQRLELKPEGEE